MTLSISDIATQISQNSYQGMSVSIAASVLGLEDDSTILATSTSLFDTSVDIVEFSAAALDAAAAEYTGFEAITFDSDSDSTYSDLASQILGTSFDIDALDEDSVLSAMLLFL
jgi:hypothetical protein